MGDLLGAGADLEAADLAGRTPLLLALEGNRKDAISALLAAGGTFCQSCLLSIEKCLLQCMLPTIPASLCAVQVHVFW